MVNGPDGPRFRPTRREMLLLGIGAFGVAAWPLGPGRSLVRRSVPVMGTTADIAVIASDRVHAQAAMTAAIAALQHVEITMTRFDPRSDVGRANRLAAREAVHIATSTEEVLREALEWAEATDGAFDPCLVRAIELWDVGSRREPPPAGSFGRLAGRRLYRHVDLGTWQGGPAVRLTDPDAGLDLGGIAKGYGVDRAVDALRRFGIERAIVNVGGDLFAMGTGADGGPWTVGVRSPERPDQVVGTLAVVDRAVATSGSYLQQFESRGRRYHHLLDPATAAPRACAMQSLTVSAETCAAADAAATAFFGSELAAGDVLKGREGRPRVEMVI